MSDAAFLNLMINKLDTLERDLAFLGKRMTGTQATAERCRKQAADIRMEIQQVLNHKKEVPND